MSRRTGAAVASKLIGGVIGVALVALAGLLTLAPAAGAQTGSADAALTQGHGYRHGVVPQRGTSAARLGSSVQGASSNNVAFGGGINGVGVTTGAPRVYLVFWGSQWGTQGTNSAGNVTLSGDPSGVAPYVEAFLKGLGTNSETWSGVATQYCQGVSTGATSCPASSTQHVGYPTGGAYAGLWVDESAAAPPTASAHKLALEAAKAATHFGNTTQTSNRNVQYVIVSPHGADPDGYEFAGFCAWHDYTGDTTLDGGGAVSPTYIAFTNLPYLPDAGASCGQNFVNSGSAGTLDGISIVEGHEYTETITDQFPAGGWTVPGNGSTAGEEVGDLCAWISSGQGASQNITLATGKFAVQSIWANDAGGGSGGCEVSHPIISNGGGPNTVTVTNPGNQTSTVGSAVSLQIKASDSGSSTLTYTVTGLPAGLSINSASGAISGTPTTASTSSVTVKATDTTGASGTASLSWTVNPASTCTGGGQLLGNPGFETGSPAPWTASTSIVEPAGAGEAPHSGTYAAWFGFGTPTQDILAQKVGLPTGCAHYTWSFWLHVDTTDTGTTQSAQMRVQLLNSSGGLLSVLGTFTNLNAASGYVQESYNLAAYAGQTVSVRFVATQMSTSAHTNFVVDDNVLNVS